MIVSPNARPRPNIVPPMIPPRPNGINTIRIIPQCVDPNANAASFSPGGHNENTSRITEHAIGITINDTTSPAMNNDDVYDPCAQSGAFASVSHLEHRDPRRMQRQPMRNKQRTRHQEEHPPQPDHHTRDRRHQIHQTDQHPLHRRRRILLIYNANPNANGNATTIATAASSNVPTSTAAIPI